MENLVNLKEKNIDLYNRLFEYNCKVTYNSKVLYEGLYKEDIDLGKYSPTQVVYEFVINDKHILLLKENNENIDKLHQLFEGKEFDVIYEDFKLFNKCMNLANKLPLYNLNEELYEKEIKSKFRKYGTNFQKIYENLVL